MSNTTEAPKSKKPNDFQDKDCSVCNTKTLHYKDSCCTCNHKLMQTGQTQSGYVYREIPIGMHRPPVNTDVVSSPIDMKHWEHSRRERENKSARVEVNEDWALAEFGGIPAKASDPLTPDLPRCSFCCKPIDNIGSYSEKKTKIKVIEDIDFNSDGAPIVTKKVIAQSVTMVACNDCSLKLEKPIATRIV